MPIRFEAWAGERSRGSTFVWRRPRIAAYYASLRDCTLPGERDVHREAQRQGGQPLGPLTTLARAPCECAIDTEHGRFFAISVFRCAILTPMSWGIGVQNVGAN